MARSSWLGLARSQLKQVKSSSILLSAALHDWGGSSFSDLSKTAVAGRIARVFREREHIRSACWLAEADNRMRLHVSGLGGKHDVDVTPEDSLRVVKQRLEPMAGLDADQMKLLVKGKQPDDAETVGALGLTDGAKVMLMRSQLGAKKAAAAAPAPASAGPSWLVVGAKVLYRAAGGTLEHATVRAVHMDDLTAPYYTIEFDGSERQTAGDRLLKPDDGAAPSTSAAAAAPAEAGAGSVTLTVMQGRRQLLLHCEPTSRVADLKALASGLVDGTPPTSMRLLSKGKEASDESTVEALGLCSGGKLMLLFRAGFHRAAVGAAVVRDAAPLLTDLRERIAATRHKVTKRLLRGAEALGELGGLSDEVAALAQDVTNAAPHEAAEAAARRTAQLAELENLAAELEEARRVEALAELRGQIGR